MSILMAVHQVEPAKGYPTSRLWRDSHWFFTRIFAFKQIFLFKSKGNAMKFTKKQKIIQSNPLVDVDGYPHKAGHFRYCRTSPSFYSFDERSQFWYTCSALFCLQKLKTLKEERDVSIRVRCSLVFLLICNLAVVSVRRISGLIGISKNKLATIKDKIIKETAALAIMMEMGKDIFSNW